jgi:hypothetical protein
MDAIIHNADAGIFKVLRNANGAVRGTVVYDEQFPVTKCLPYNR